MSRANETMGWRDVALTDVLSAIVDNRGRSCPTEAQGFPLIATNCIKNDSLYPIFENVRYISEETKKTWFRAHPVPGDILFVCKGSPGRIALTPDPVPFAIAQDMVALRADPEIIDGRFLFYVLRSPQVQHEIGNLHVGTMIPHFKKGDFPKLRFSIPVQISEQRRIAGVLGALDDLIEVNRGLIADLLELVNAEFSARFGERRLSVAVGTLAKVTDCLHSKKPERMESPHRLLQLSNIKDSGQLDLGEHFGISTEDYQRWSANIETREWDCVITNVGRVGAVARIPRGVRAALGRNMTAIRPIFPDMDGAFLLASLLSKPVRGEISLKTDSGTVMDALNVKNIPHLRLPESTQDERRAFQGFSAPLLSASDLLSEEIRELEATRNELLPLLMSGRVRVGDVAA